MKFCTKCGAQLADENRFCTNCGANAEQPRQYYSQQGYANQPYDGIMPDGRQINGIIDTVGSSLNSPPFLVTILAFTIVALFSFITIFTDGGALASIMAAMDNAVPGISAELPVRGFSVGLSLIAFIPTVLCLIGIWKLYFVRFDRPIPASGFKLLKAYFIIRLVLVSISCVFMAFLLLVAFAALGSDEGYPPYYYYSDGVGLVSFMLILIAVILIVMAVLFIIFYAKACKTAGVIESAGSTGQLTGRMSTYVAVFNIIIAICSLISLTGTSAGLFSVISSLCGIAMRFALSIYIFQLKGRLTPYYMNRPY